MTPNDELYTVTINGTAYPADLASLRQWVMEGRIGPYMPVTRNGRSPMVARETPELRDLFQPPPVAPPPANIPIPSPTFSTSGAPSAYHPQPVYQAAAPRPFAVPKFYNEYAGDFPNARHKKDSRYRAAVRLFRYTAVTCLILSSFMVLGGLVLFLSPVRVVNGNVGVDPGVLLLVVSLLFFALNLGLYFGSRACAVLLFIWLFFAFIGNLLTDQSSASVLLALFLDGLFFLSIIGTSNYQSFRKQVESGQI